MGLLIFAPGDRCGASFLLRFFDSEKKKKETVERSTERMGKGYRRRKNIQKGKGLHEEIQQYYYDEEREQLRELAFWTPQLHPYFFHPVWDFWHFSKPLLDLDDILNCTLQPKSLKTMDEQLIEFMNDNLFVSATHMVEIYNRMEDKELFSSNMESFFLPFLFENMGCCEGCRRNYSKNPGDRPFFFLYYLEKLKTIFFCMKQEGYINFFNEYVHEEHGSIFHLLLQDWKFLYEMTQNYQLNGDMKDFSNKNVLHDPQIRASRREFSFNVAFIAIYYEGASRVEDEVNEEPDPYDFLFDNEEDYSQAITELITRNLNYFFLIWMVVILKKNGENCHIEKLPRELMKSLLNCFVSKELFEKMQKAMKNMNEYQKAIDIENRLYYCQNEYQINIKW